MKDLRTRRILTRCGAQNREGEDRERVITVREEADTATSSEDNKGVILQSPGHGLMKVFWNPVA